MYLAWRVLPMSVFCVGMFLWEALRAGFNVTWGEQGALVVRETQNDDLHKNAWRY